MRTNFLQTALTSAFIFCIITGMQTAQIAQAAPKQLVFSLSQNQAHSQILMAWGVPACVTVGGERPKGLYITGVTGDGLATQLGVEVGDVLLSLNGHVILEAGQADGVLKKIPSGSLKAVIARPSGGTIRFLNPTVAYTASALNQSYGSGQSVSVVASRDKVDGQTVAALESYMFDLVNQDRATYKLPPLSRSSELSSLARRYAEDMVKRHFFDHRDPDGNQPKDRARAAGINASVWENLSLQEGSSMSLKTLVARGEAQMMAEPPGMLNHRGCILHPEHKTLGVGVAVAGPKVYCVQEFSPANLQ